MASILTEQFRKNAADLLIADITKPGNSYYVGIGKSDNWYEPLSTNINAPFPKGTLDDTRNLQYALSDLLKVNLSDTSYVIPRVRLISGSYKQYSSYDPACFYPDGTIKPCYFVDDDSGNIYLFIYSKNATAISQGSINTVLYQITSGAPYAEFVSGSETTHIAVLIGKTVLLSPFNNEQFVEVDTTLGDPQDDIISAKNRVYGFHVMSEGSYSGVTNSSVLGTVQVYNKDQSGALSIPVTIDFSDGVISKVTPTVDYYGQLISDSVLSSHDFTDARVELDSISGITETDPAFIVPLICRNGFGYNIREYTPSWYLGFMINSREAEHSVYSGYRQVSILKNPKASNDTVLSAQEINMKKSFVLTGFTTDVTGYQITQGDMKIGIVDSFDSDTSTVYYNNSIKYGFDTPVTTQHVTFVNVDTLATVTSGVNPSSLYSPDFSYGSADVIFIDNRALIQRSADQNEELKIIIQL